MKRITKILVGMAMFAVVVGLTGCQGVNIGGSDSIEGNMINGSTKKAYVGAKGKDDEGITNSDADTIREMKLFATKHYGAFAALTLVEPKNAAGQLGLVFNYTENKDDDNKVKSVNFITVGYRYNGQKYASYISQFYNIDPNKLSEKNFGCNTYKSAKDPNVTTPYEVPVGLSTTNYTSDNTVDTIDLNSFVTLDQETKEATIGVEVVAGDDGTYKVKYYKTEDVEGYKKKKNADPVKVVDIGTVVTGYSPNKKTPQTKMGCYANIIGKTVTGWTGKPLKGFWRFSEIKGEAIPEEELEPIVY